MELNLHPIFVHFPIALLCTYALFELVPSKKLGASMSWFRTKAILAIFGTLTAFVALQTGEMIEDAFKGQWKNIVELHSAWAVASTWIFGIAATLYLLEWIRREGQPITSKLEQWEWSKEIFSMILKIESLLMKKPILILLALAGLAAMTITGALGGIIAHGPDTDPVTQWIYNFIK